MSDWHKFSEMAPPRFRILEVGEPKGRARLVILGEDALIDVLTIHPVRENYTHWREYRASVLPDCQVTDRFAPSPEIDEPGFLLVARDPVAAPLVRAWGYLRQGQYGLARDEMGRVIEASKRHHPQHGSDPQIMSAFRIASQMEDWAIKKAVS